ncbi:hypothetical protein F2P56_032804 [Juglans regia]|uniref:Zinc knuckle CX2CX4HX4C domain-containing protein n=2 Tax=Juglans regia TaxID=51240 RepID=A0A833WX26_JUGRE|nr:uncharacterized protein At4g02000-like [Juglans regia]KAF5447236.1 hypothetical protein F2P56_032804 [Juglans regia]
MEAVESTMARIWRISKRATFKEVEVKVFVITFVTQADKHWILEGKLWLFENALFLLIHYDGVLQPGKFPMDHESFWLQIHSLPLGCMTEECGQQIGSSVGKVLEVDVGEDGIGWGKALRVRVEVPLTKAIARGSFLNVQGQKVWVTFKYEKLPKICFSCGWILHGETGCLSGKGDQSETDENSRQFGPWLRAERNIRRRYSSYTFEWRGSKEGGTRASGSRQKGEEAEGSTGSLAQGGTPSKADQG